MVLGTEHVHPNYGRSTSFSFPLHENVHYQQLYILNSRSFHQLGLAIVEANLAEWKWLAHSIHQTNWKSLSHGVGSADE